MGTKEWENLLNDMVEKHDLYGRSFTWGVALYKAIVEGWLSDVAYDQLDELLRVYYGELYNELDKLRMHTTLRAWAELLDISTLDELAKELAGDYDE